MVNIRQDITRVNYESGNSGRKYIVIHYTGNETDRAAANANYFRDTWRGVSAHLFVDPNEIVEVVRESDTSFAVGKNYGKNNLYNICTNRNSISIEMCSNGGKVAGTTFNNTVDLVKHLMSKYNIPVERVVRHWDVCSKRCPGWSGWLPGDDNLWKQFKEAIMAVKDGWIKEGPSYRYYKKGNYVRNEWHKIGGSYFYFNKEGYILTNEWVEDKKRWFWLQAGGHMACKGWLQINNVWYYFKSDGILIEEQFLDEGDGIFYLQKGGSMAKGVRTINEKMYIFGEDGRLLRNRIVNKDGIVTKG